MSGNAIDYNALELEKSGNLQDDLSKKLAQQKDMGRSDSLKNVVLSFVVKNDYDSARSELKKYVASKSDYPNFQSRAERYVDHCVDLIYAINTKRNFPGLAALPLSKQQDIHDRVLDHFDELKSVVKKIEALERDTKLSDVKSTVWFIKSLINSAFFVITVGFIIEVVNSMGSSFYIVMNDIINKLTDKIMGLF